MLYFILLSQYCFPILCAPSLDATLLRLRSALHKSAQKSLSRNVSAVLSYEYSLALCRRYLCSKISKLKHLCLVASRALSPVHYFVFFCKSNRFRRSFVRIFPTLCRTAMRNCTSVSFCLSANRTVFQLCQYNVCEEKANMRSIRFYIRKPAPTRQNIFINQKHIYRLINLHGVHENYT